MKCVWCGSRDLQNDLPHVKIYPHLSTWLLLYLYSAYQAWRSSQQHTARNVWGCYLRSGFCSDCLGCLQCPHQEQQLCTFVFLRETVGKTGSGKSFWGKLQFQLVHIVIFFNLVAYRKISFKENIQVACSQWKLGTGDWISCSNANCLFEKILKIYKPNAIT